MLWTAQIYSSSSVPCALNAYLAQARHFEDLFLPWHSFLYLNPPISSNFSILLQSTYLYLHLSVSYFQSCSSQFSTVHTENFFWTTNLLMLILLLKTSVIFFALEVKSKLNIKISFLTAVCLPPFSVPFLFNYITE